MPVKTKNLPSLEVLNELFYLDDSSPTGLRWKVSNSNRIKVNDPAGTKHSEGYWQVGITKNKKEIYLCHRIVYYMKNKIDPGDKFIDHLYNKRNANNDLRLCDFKDNTRNRKKDSQNYKTSSKFKGVSWDKFSKKWKAQICFEYKNINLGRFFTEEEAALAYNKAAIKFFGEYAWLNKIN